METRGCYYTIINYCVVESLSFDNNWCKIYIGRLAGHDSEANHLAVLVQCGPIGSHHARESSVVIFGCICRSGEKMERHVELFGRDG